MSSSEDQVSSPEATGGAGTLFEQHVDAGFLALLLVRGVPPVHTNCHLSEVHFQTEHKGWQTDDILLVGVSGANRERKLAGQIKRTFTVSAKSEKCKATFTDFWNDFQATDRFSPARDAFVLIVQRGTEALVKHFSTLLDCARASKDASDFIGRLSVDGFLHKKSRTQATEVRTILDEANGAPVSNGEFWRFLRSLHVLILDLATATAQTEAAIKTLLAHTTSDADPMGVAESTWLKLVALASSAMSMAGSFTLEALPEELRESHSPVGSTEHRALTTLKEHSATILDGIKGTVGDAVSIPRDRLVAQVLGYLEGGRIVIVTGPAGNGKSVLAKEALHVLSENHFCFAFRAEEFKAPHLDDTLHRAQLAVGGERLSAILAAQGRKVLLIESVERLLESAVRDSFADLLRLVRADESWHLVLTCREYSLDVVRSALLEHIGLPDSLIRVPAFTDEELDSTAERIPVLARPLGNPRLRRLLRTPYLLDKAARMDWPEGQLLPEDERGFRKKFWQDVVRDDAESAGGLPQRRSQAFIALALRRAQTLSLFVSCENLDPEALGKLRSRSLVASPKETESLAAPAHDVLEDWAILQWLDERFAKHEGDVTQVSSDVGGFPAIRRAYRKWLGEQLEHTPDVGDSFVLSVLRAEDIAPHFQDDTAVSVLQSSQAARFIQQNQALLLVDNCALLRRVIHLLRVACRSKPDWIRSGRGLPSVLLIPAGSGWAPALEVVASAMDKFLPAEVTLLVGFIEDWARSVAVWLRYPSGSADAARIAFGVLPHLDGYGLDELRKRVLEVIAKIPKAEGEKFIELVERGRAGLREDHAAREFAELLLEGMSGGFACRDYPQQMIALSESLFCLTDSDLEQRRRFDSSPEIEPQFGIKGGLRHDFFPPSALRGPFAPLLSSHPNMGVEFIVRLMNHAATWYSERKWPGFCLEGFFEARVQVPDHGEVVQFANGRFWATYRGTSVMPSVLQTALMALEAWLLGLAKAKNPHVEAWLLKCLTESNNVAVSAVVASVCNAHPALAGMAGVALLSCREFFDMDRWRMVNESSGRVFDMFPSLGVQNELYDRERKEAAELDHRGYDLEALAVRLQLGDHREAVQAIIDSHRAELPDEDEQSEEDRLWRLVLHRVDTRNFREVSPPPASEDDPANDDGSRGEAAKPAGTYYAAGPPEEDIQRMLEERLPAHELQQRDLAFFNWGVGAWRRGSAAEPSDWRDQLQDVRVRLAEAEKVYEPARGAPGFVACVCVRDHWEELTQEEKDWCVEAVIDEATRDCDDNEPMNQVSRNGLDPSRPAAYLLPRLIQELGLDALGGRLADAASKAITHATAEVVVYAAEGFGDYLAVDHRDFTLNCVGALAVKARLVAELQAQEDEKPYQDRRQHSELEQTVAPEVRRLIVEGGVQVPEEVANLDLDTWTGRESAKAILAVLDRSPEDAIAQAAYERLAHKLVEWWAQDRRDRGHGSRRDYEFEFTSLRKLAHFVLKLSIQDALRICVPLVEAVGEHPRDLARFVVDLIIEEDHIEGQSPFWSIWQRFADALPSAGWAAQLGSWRYEGEPEFLRAMFLNAPWKVGVRHWSRLEGEADRVDALLRSLPACAVVLEGYSRFLSTVGAHSLPNAFILIADGFDRSSAEKMLSRSNIVFNLESPLRRFVYSEPIRVKSDPKIREAVLTILDGLVEAGSSAAYRMRDDFVTPLASRDS